MATWRVENITIVSSRFITINLLPILSDVSHHRDLILRQKSNHTAWRDVNVRRVIIEGKWIVIWTRVNDEVCTNFKHVRRATRCEWAKFSVAFVILPVASQAPPLTVGRLSIALSILSLVIRHSKRNKYSAVITLDHSVVRTRKRVSLELNIRSFSASVSRKRYLHSHEKISLISGEWARLPGTIGRITVDITQAIFPPSRFFDIENRKRRILFRFQRF